MIFELVSSLAKIAFQPHQPFLHFLSPRGRPSLMGKLSVILKLSTDKAYTHLLSDTEIITKYFESKTNFFNEE